MNKCCQTAAFYLMICTDLPRFTIYFVESLCRQLYKDGKGENCSASCAQIVHNFTLKF